MFPLKAGTVLWSHLSNLFHRAFQHNEPQLCRRGCPLRPILGLGGLRRSHPEKMVDSLYDTFANDPQTSIHSLAGMYACKSFKVLRSETNLGVARNVKQKNLGSNNPLLTPFLCQLFLGVLHWINCSASQPKFPHVEGNRNSYLRLF